MRNELYLGSISAKATEEDIRKLFSVAGTVTSIHLIHDQQTGEFKGCGYVRMATPEQAKEAIEVLDGALLINRVLSVSEARPQPASGKKRFPGNNRRAASSSPAAPKGKNSRKRT
jgi:RNA recognition motif-containing protein